MTTIKCELCGAESDLENPRLEMIVGTIQNTLTPLPDRNNPKFKCWKCGGWSPDEDEIVPRGTS